MQATRAFEEDFFEISAEEGMGSIPLPIDNLPAGMYVVKVQSQSGKARQLKLILR